MAFILNEPNFTAFLQNIAEAVASVLKFDVTITDSSLTRIAGTGRYRDLLGTRVPESSSFGRVLRTHEPKIITNPKEDPVCLGCERSGVCLETCHLSYPLLYNGKAFGVMALVSFTKKQKESMLAYNREHLNFLMFMSQLIVYAIQNRQAIQQAKEARDHLQGIVDSLEEGIVAIDKEGEIICCNKSGAQILGQKLHTLFRSCLSAYSPRDPLLQVLQSKKPYTNKEVQLEKGIYFLSSGQPLLSNGDLVGAVAVIQKMVKVHQLAYSISSQQIHMSIEEILGKHHRILETKETAMRIAAQNANVLVRGESGTGKELFARAIHHHSSRNKKNFLSVNCAALPEDLLESELFGYEEGSFTGAKKGGKPGKFEVAHQGTLFLDEVADCSLHLQAKLLRVLDVGEIQRVGSTKTFRVDVRIIAATNRDLEEMVENGEFREDLYYRLNVLPLTIPPLRERSSDISLLLRHFLQKHGDGSQQIPHISSRVLDILVQYHWPGNVRELENTAQYLLSESRGESIVQQHLPRRILKPKKMVDGRGDGFTFIMPVKEWEKKAISEGLSRYGKMPGGRDILARQLGMGRSTLYRKIKEYRLE